MQRPWYYFRVYADTQKADTVYVLNVGFHKSADGGRTFYKYQRAAFGQPRFVIAPGQLAKMD
jgi:hypothetical protein